MESQKRCRQCNLELQNFPLHGCLPDLQLLVLYQFHYHVRYLSGLSVAGTSGFRKQEHSTFAIFASTKTTQDEDRQESYRRNTLEACLASENWSPFWIPFIQMLSRLLFFHKMNKSFIELLLFQYFFVERRVVKLLRVLLFFTVIFVGIFSAWYY